MDEPDRREDRAAVAPALRRFIGPDGVLQRVRLAAYAWSEDDHRVLLCRIREGQREGGRWTLPGGGLRFGEDPVEGVLRELGEETGLEGRVQALLGVHSAVLQPGETATGHRIHTVGILYRVAITGGTLRDEADGSTDLARWVQPSEARGLPVVGLVSWATSLVEGGLRGR